MPEEMESALKETAMKRGYGKERTGRYVFGGMANAKKKKKRTVADIQADGFMKRRGR